MSERKQEHNPEWFKLKELAVECKGNFALALFRAGPDVKDKERLEKYCAVRRAFHAQTPEVDDIEKSSCDFEDDDDLVQFAVSGMRAMDDELQCGQQNEAKQNRAV